MEWNKWTIGSLIFALFVALYGLSHLVTKEEIEKNDLVDTPKILTPTPIPSPAHGHLAASPPEPRFPGLVSDPPSTDPWEAPVVCSFPRCKLRHLLRPGRAGDDHVPPCAHSPPGKRRRFLRALSRQIILASRSRRLLPPPNRRLVAWVDCRVGRLITWY